MGFTIGLGVLGGFLAITSPYYISDETRESIKKFSKLVIGIEIDFDGADEFDGNGNLIKGGGGALVREKGFPVNI